MEEILLQHTPGLIRLSAMEQELASIFQHKVDLRTPEDLSSYFRQEVLDMAVVQYVYSIRFNCPFRSQISNGNYWRKTYNFSDSSQTAIA